MDIKEFILAKCLKGQSDIEIITEKDYISQPIVLPTIPFGTISPGKASRSSYEAEQQESVLKQGS